MKGNRRIRTVSITLTMLFLICFCGVFVSLSRASDGLVQIDVSVKGTYLLADGSVDPPGIADLQGNGISGGDTILISFEGSINVYGESEYVAITRLGGVFSSTDELLSSSEANRVPGAIDAGEDLETSQTFFSLQDTDIPEDFEIDPPEGFSIRVPQNGNYLIVSYLDSYYTDNVAPEPIHVTIEKQAGGFPLEYVLVVLAVVVIATLLVFVGFRRRKAGTQNSS